MRTEWSSRFTPLLPPATKLGQGYIFTGICDSVNRGAVCSEGYSIPACTEAPRPDTPLGVDTPHWSRHPPEQTSPWSRHPQEQTSPKADTPRSRHPPGADTTPVQSMLRDTVNAQAVRILLECNLVTNMWTSR